MPYGDDSQSTLVAKYSGTDFSFRIVLKIPSHLLLRLA